MIKAVVFAVLVFATVGLEAAAVDYEYGKSSDKNFIFLGLLYWPVRYRSRHPS